MNWVKGEAGYRLGALLLCGVLIAGYILWVATPPRRGNRRGAEKAVQEAKELVAKAEFDAAIPKLDKAIHLDRSYGYAYFIRGGAHWVKRDYDQALRDLNTAIEIDGFDPDSSFLRGRILQDMKKYELAIKDFDMAVGSGLNDPMLFLCRGRAFLESKQFDKAIEDFIWALGRARKTEPRAWQAEPLYSCGRAYHAKKEYKKAIEYFDDAIHSDPKHVDARNYKAWLLAVCPDKAVRDGKLAVRLATEACELVGWKDGFGLNTLATAYAELGDFEKAVEWEQKALENKEYAAEHGGEARKRLELYKAKTPYREE